MRHKFFHIPVLYAEQAEEELNQFCSQHRIAQACRVHSMHQRPRRLAPAFNLTQSGGSGGHPGAWNAPYRV